MSAPPTLLTGDDEAESLARARWNIVWGEIERRGGACERRAS